MLKQSDLEAAITAGIISADQADKLNNFAAERRKPSNFAAGRDERFRLLGGLNDFFIAIGVVLLASGIIFGATRFHSAIVYLIGVGLFWALAEYLTGRLRLTAPSIVLAAMLPIFASLVVGEVVKPAIPLLVSGAGLVIAIAHYLRFRLPFSAAVVAVAGLAVTLALVHLAGLAAMNKLVFLIYGIALFAIAMWFDSSDPERLTRRADHGFWLHFAAAPMIVHPLVQFLSTGASGHEGLAALAIVVLAIGLAGIALIVDRRAVVIMSLAYLGTAIGYVVSQFSGSEGNNDALTITLLFLGAIIVTLGVGWHTIRYRLMQLLPDHAFKSFLPPVKE